MDPIKDSVEIVISQVLDGTELKLQIDALSMEENFKTGEMVLRCDVHDLRNGEKVAVNGRGVGLVDAFVKGMLESFGSTYLSLRDINFTDFTVRGKHEPNKEGRGSEAVAEATVRAANGPGQGVLFNSTSPSITRASLTTVLRGIEFFMNSERAFVSLHKARQRARQDKRPDSEQRYTQQLSILVQLNDYTEVLAQLPTL